MKKIPILRRLQKNHEGWDESDALQFGFFLSALVINGCGGIG
jgi:hypothetical protein